MTISPLFKHALWAIPLLSGLTIVGLAWHASRLLVSPNRRPLQDYHRELLTNPASHGLTLRSFEVQGTPCLLCEPTATPSAKGQILRDQLQQREVPLPDRGTILGTVILVHGHSGRKEDHLPVAERFCAVGFRCLLFDVPGHGDHPSSTTTFGLTEASLPKAVLELAAERFEFDPTPAGLFGVSQGGAIVLQAAARDAEVWTAVAELSSFATLSQVIRHEARRFGPLARPTATLMRRFVRSRAGFDPRTVRPVDAVQRLNCLPVLIGHGNADQLVTPDHAKKLFTSCQSSQKQFLSIPGASHGQVFVTEAPVYATLSQFFLESMVPTPFTR